MGLTVERKLEFRWRLFQKNIKKFGIAKPWVPEESSQSGVRIE
jgi:hypothetical protein